MGWHLRAKALSDQKVIWEYRVTPRRLGRGSSWLCRICIGTDIKSPSPPAFQSSHSPESNPLRRLTIFPPGTAATAIIPALNAGVPGPCHSVAQLFQRGIGWVPKKEPGSTLTQNSQGTLRETAASAKTLPRSPHCDRRGHAFSIPGLPGRWSWDVLITW